MCLSFFLNSFTHFKYNYNYEIVTVIKNFAQDIHSMKNFPYFKIATKPEAMLKANALYFLNW